MHSPTIREPLTGARLDELLQSIQRGELTYRGPDITLRFAQSLVRELDRKAGSVVDARLRELRLSSEALGNIRRLSDDIDLVLGETSDVPDLEHMPADRRATAHRRPHAVRTARREPRGEERGGERPTYVGESEFGHMNKQGIETRKRVFELLGNDGMGIQEAAEALDMNTVTVATHIKALMRIDQAHVSRSVGKKRYYAQGAGSHENGHTDESQPHVTPAPRAHADVPTNGYPENHATPKKNTDTPVAKRHQSILQLVTGEPHTIHMIAAALNVSTFTVRTDLKTITEQALFTQTKRGRVVWYHMANVEPPHGERPSDETFEGLSIDGLADDGETTDHDERIEDADDVESTDRVDDGVDEASPLGEIAGRSPFDGIEEHADPTRAVPAFDPESQRASSIDRLLTEITNDQVPFVIEAMDRMAKLTKDNDALSAFYDEWVVEHGLDKHLLIRFYMVTVAHGIDPASLFDRKKDTPAIALQPVAITEAEENEESDNENSHTDVPFASLTREIAALEAVHGMDEEMLPRIPESRWTTTRVPTRETVAKHVIDPEMTPSRQMDVAVFRKKANDLGRAETDLASALTDVEGRLSAHEWSEYAQLVGMTARGEHTPETQKRFRELLGKAHRTVPATIIQELGVIMLTPPLLRTESTVARYHQILRDFFEA